MITRPTLIATLIAAAIGAAGGYTLAAKAGAAKTARIEAQLARCAQGRAEDARAAAEAAAQLLARAQDAEAQAAARLAVQQSAFERRLKEVRSEIYRLTTGRECLSGALRLRLNAALDTAGHVPEAAGAAALAPAGPAADPGLSSPPGRRDGGEGAILPSPPGRGAGGEGATDSDIAGWIVEAAGLYEQCRARIDALREWDAVTHGR